MPAALRQIERSAIIWLHLIAPDTRPTRGDTIAAMSGRRLLFLLALLLPAMIAMSRPPATRVTAPLAGAETADVLDAATATAIGLPLGTTTALTVPVAPTESAAVVLTATPAATASTPTPHAKPTARPTPRRAAPAPHPSAAPVPRATPRPRHGTRHQSRHATHSRRGRAQPRPLAHRAVPAHAANRRKAVRQRRALRPPAWRTRRPPARRVVPQPALQTLILWAQPRDVRVNGTVTIGIRVNDTRAQIVLVTLYGPGLRQQRDLSASPHGPTLVRLRAIAPAHCSGRIMARVYVTATSSDHAVTRATTFTVGCAGTRRSR